MNICRAAYDLRPVWPLCGRITEDPPDGWTEGQGCPSERAGQAAFTDFPINSSFGPRQLSDGQYDFHRAIDLSTPEGTPVFAIAAGVVRASGVTSGYQDPIVHIRHFRPGAAGCTSGQGCYHSLYLHMSSWEVEADETVEKGQLIGHSGASSSGYEHLHFEIRDATANDPFSSFSRDAIHPMSVLVYPDSGPSDLSLEVDVSDAAHPVVQVTVTTEAADLDFQRVEVSLAGGAQPGNTADENGWYLNSPWFDIHFWNRAWTHKHSTNFPWSSFDNCPHASEHGASYSSGVHMDRSDPESEAVGLFNGVRITKHPGSPHTVTYEFLELINPQESGEVCVTANTLDVSGSHASATWGCAGP